MKSVLVFLRILIVGCLWGIVFTEGIRVIMLCNWHFDIFWPDHWHQFATTWKAGWVPRAPKEWAFIILIVVFFPMLITGWWTLCMVAWEEIIWKILKLPFTLYNKYFGNTSLSSISAGNNRYGVVKRKSYKLIRPAGINTLRVPISDYGSTTTSAPLSAPAAPAYSAPYASANSAAAPAPATAKKKTDVAATIDHALFKFDDDDDDDFDLDIDSFEKADLSKKKAESRPRKRPVEDDEEEFTPPKRTKPKYDFDDDDEDERDEDEDEDESRFESTAASRRGTKERDSARKSSRKTSEEAPKRSTRTRRSAEDDDETEHRSRAAESRATEATRGPVYEALLQKNYEVIPNVAVKNTVIDFVGVSESDIYLCLVDKESGDWLADEEMFNGEEPLWFSESSHRVSPVCKLNNVKKQIEDALDDGGFDQKVSSCVVIQMANIINADDMFDIWNEMGIEVTRINRGAPKEIKLFSKFLTEADGKVSKKELENLRKVFKSIK